MAVKYQVVEPKSSKTTGIHSVQRPDDARLRFALCSWDKIREEWCTYEVTSPEGCSKIAQWIREHNSQLSRSLEVSKAMQLHGAMHNVLYEYQADGGKRAFPIIATWALGTPKNTGGGLYLNFTSRDTNSVRAMFVEYGLRLSEGSYEKPAPIKRYAAIFGDPKGAVRRARIILDDAGTAEVGAWMEKHKRALAEISSTLPTLAMVGSPSNRILLIYEDGTVDQMYLVESLPMAHGVKSLPLEYKTVIPTDDMRTLESIMERRGIGFRFALCEEEAIPTKYVLSLFRDGRAIGEEYAVESSKGRAAVEAWLSYYIEQLYLGKANANSPSAVAAGTVRALIDSREICRYPLLLSYEWGASDKGKPFVVGNLRTEDIAQLKRVFAAPND